SITKQKVDIPGSNVHALTFDKDGYAWHYQWDDGYIRKSYLDNYKISDNTYTDTSATDNTPPDTLNAPTVTAASTTQLDISWSTAADAGDDYYYYLKSYDDEGNSGAVNLLALYNIDWTNPSSWSSSSGISWDSAENALKVVDNHDVHLDKTKIPIDTSKKYFLEYDIKQVRGTTRRSYSGTHSYATIDGGWLPGHPGSYDYFCDHGYSFTDNIWYHRRNNKISGEPRTGESSTVSEIDKWHTGTKYATIMFLFNYNGPQQTTYIKNLKFYEYDNLKQDYLAKDYFGKNATITTGTKDYYADETTGSGTDSGWTSSTSYSDTGLSCFSQYTYKIKARDYADNEGTDSATAGRYPIDYITACVGTGPDGYCWTGTTCYYTSTGCPSETTSCPSGTDTCCTDSSTITEGVGCTSGGAIGTAYDRDTSLSRCTSSASGCTPYTWISTASGTDTRCCGDDSGETWQSGADSYQSCCSATPMADDNFCSDNNRWAVDGLYCNNPVRDPSTNSGTTISGNDIVCGCDSSGVICDSTDAGPEAEGICASGTCDINLVAKSGSTYYSSCSNGYLCDSNVNSGGATPTWIQDGSCVNTVCCGSSIMSGEGLGISPVWDGDELCGCSATYNGYGCDADGDSTWDGVCVGTTCVTDLVSYDGTTWGTTCDSRPSSGCDSDIGTDSSARYTQNGFCAMSGTSWICDTSPPTAKDCELNNAGACDTADTTYASCGVHSSWSDSCDTSIAGHLWGKTGTCIQTSCDESYETVKISSTYYNDCADASVTDGIQCDSSATSGADYANDGICIKAIASAGTASDCDTDEVCHTGTAYQTDCSVCGDNKACDSDIDSSGYIRTGSCQSSNCCPYGSGGSSGASCDLDSDCGNYADTDTCNYGGDCIGSCICSYSTDNTCPVESSDCEFGSCGSSYCYDDEDDTCYYTSSTCGTSGWTDKSSTTCYDPGHETGDTCYYDTGGSVNEADSCTATGCTGISSETHPSCTSGDMTGTGANCWTGTSCMYNSGDACAADTDGWDYSTAGTYCSATTSVCCTDTSTIAEGVGCTTTGATGATYDRDSSSGRCTSTASGCTAYTWMTNTPTSGTQCCGDDTTSDNSYYYSASPSTATTLTCEICNSGSYAAPETLYGNGYKSGLTCYYSDITCTASSAADGTTCTLTDPDDVCLADVGCLNKPIGLTATARTDKPLNSELGKILLDWTDTAAIEEGFSIERSTDGTSFTGLAMVGADINSYTDDNIDDNTIYYYRIRSYNGGDYSEYSNVADATTKDRTGPDSPNLTVTADNTNNEMDLNWTQGDDGLVLYTPFEEGSGTSAYDASGFGNTGTLQNGPTWVAGVHGKALEFDGTDDYVNCGNDPSLNITDEITIEGFYKFHSMGCSRYQRFAHDDSFYILPREGRYVLWAIYLEGGGGGYIGQTFALTPETWYHLALVYDSTTHWAYGYVNGAQVFSYEFTGESDYHLRTGSNILLLGGSETGCAFNGTIDEVRIYNRSLSQQEIIDDYQSGLITHGLHRSNTSSGTYEPVDGLWDDFDDGDYTNNPTWTASGGTWTVENNQVKKTVDGWYHKLYTDGTWSDAVFESDIYLTESWAGIVIRKQDGDTTEGWLFHLIPSASTDDVRFWNPTDGNIITANMPLSYNTWYHIKAITKGQNYKLYVDDVLAIDYTDPYSRYSSGEFGLSTDINAGYALYDNIKITSLIADNSHTDTDATDNTPPATPSAPTVTVASASQLDISWSPTADAGDDYYYYLKAYDNEGNENNLLYLDDTPADTDFEYYDSSSKSYVWNIDMDVSAGEKYSFSLLGKRSDVTSSRAYVMFRLLMLDGTLIDGTMGLVPGWSSTSGEPLYYYFAETNGYKELQSYTKLVTLPVITIPDEADGGKIEWIKIVIVGTNSATYTINDARFDKIASSTVLTGTKDYYADETTTHSGASDYEWGTSTSYSDSGLACNTQYTYQVKARDYAENIASYSGTVSRYTTVDAPGTPSVSCGTSTSLAVSWSGVCANNNPQYYVEETSGNAGATNYSWGTVTSYTDDTLDCFSQYSYKVKARNAENIETSYSGTADKYPISCISGCSGTGSQGYCWVSTTCHYTGTGCPSSSTYCSSGITTCCTDSSTIAESVNCTSGGATGATYDRDTSEVRCTSSASGCDAYGTNYWNIGGEIAATTCCQDDPGEYKIVETFGTGMDGSSDSSDACCNADNKCTGDGACKTSTSSYDADNDGDTDYCNAGTWIDCNSDSNCPAGSYCSGNDCITCQAEHCISHPNCRDGIICCDDDAECGAGRICVSDQLNGEHAQCSYSYQCRAVESLALGNVMTTQYSIQAYWDGDSSGNGNCGDHAYSVPNNPDGDLCFRYDSYDADGNINALVVTTDHDTDTGSSSPASGGDVWAYNYIYNASDTANFHQLEIREWDTGFSNVMYGYYQTEKGSTDGTDSTGCCDSATDCVDDSLKGSAARQYGCYDSGICHDTGSTETGAEYCDSGIWRDRDYSQAICQVSGSGCTAYTWMTTAVKCCGDDGVADDFENAGAGNSCCVNGETVTHDTRDSSNQFLCLDGEIYSCNSAGTFAFDTDDGSCARRSTWYCDGSGTGANTWKAQISNGQTPDDCDGTSDSYYGADEAATTYDQESCIDNRVKRDHGNGPGSQDGPWRCSLAWYGPYIGQCYFSQSDSADEFSTLTIKWDVSDENPDSPSTTGRNRWRIDNDGSGTGSCTTAIGCYYDTGVRSSGFGWCVNVDANEGTYGDYWSETFNWNSFTNFPSSETTYYLEIGEEECTSDQIDATEDPNSNEGQCTTSTTLCIPPGYQATADTDCCPLGGQTGTYPGKDDDGGNCIKCSGLIQSIGGTGDTKCEQKCGSHASCDEVTPYGLVSASGWCHDSEGCTSWCTSHVVDADTNTNFGDPSDICGCSATYEGFICDNNFDGSAEGSCVDNMCCSDDIVKNGGNYVCGCTATYNGGICDSDPENGLEWDGVCAKDNTGTWDCDIDTVFFDSTHYRQQRSSDGSTDGRACENGLIGNNGFNQEGYGLDDGACDTVGLVAEDCDSDTNPACAGTEPFYNACGARSAYGDSCDTTLTSGVSWTQMGTCLDTGDIEASCDVSDEVVKSGTSYYADCRNSGSPLWGAICDASANSGGDFNIEGICAYDGGSTSSDDSYDCDGSSGINAVCNPGNGEYRTSCSISGCDSNEACDYSGTSDGTFDITGHCQVNACCQATGGSRQQGQSCDEDGDCDNYNAADTCYYGTLGDGDDGDCNGSCACSFSNDTTCPILHTDCEFGGCDESYCYDDEDDTCYYTSSTCGSGGWTDKTPITCRDPGYETGDTCYYDNGGSVNEADSCTATGCTGISSETHPSCTSGDMTGTGANCWTGTSCMYNSGDACAADTDGWDYSTAGTYCSASTSVCCTDTSTIAEGVGCTTTGATGTTYDRDTTSARCTSTASGCTVYTWMTNAPTSGTQCCGDDTSSDNSYYHSAPPDTATTLDCERCDAGSYAAPATLYGNSYKSGLTCYYGNITCNSSSALHGTTCTLTDPDDTCIADVGCLNQPTALEAESRTDKPLNSELGKIIITWTDTASVEDGFRIERRTDNISFTEIATVGANIETYTDDNINDNILYYYRIRSYWGSSYSDYSNVASAITKDKTGPDSPNLTVTADNTNNEIDLNWTQEDKDLVLYMPFEEGSGTSTEDWSAEGNDGEITGASWTTGKSENGGAMSFDGLDDYVVWSYTKPSNSFTMEAWAKTNVTHQIDAESTSGVGGTSGQKYLFGANHESSNGGAGISVGTNGISVYEHGDSYMPALAVYNGDVGSDWVHIVVVYSNKQPKIYLNGNLVRTGLTSTRTIVYAPIKMGGGSYGHFNGSIDEVRIYNKALTQQEIINDMQSGLIRHGLYHSNTSSGTYEPVDGLYDNVEATSKSAKSVSLDDDYIFKFDVKQSGNPTEGWEVNDGHVNIDRYSNSNNIRLHYGGQEKFSVNVPMTLDEYEHIKIIRSGAVYNVYHNNVFVGGHDYGSSPAVSMMTFVNAQTGTTTWNNIKVTPLIADNTHTDTSATDNTPPATPSAPTVTAASASQLDISWTTAADAGDDYYYYLKSYDDEGNEDNLANNGGMEKDSNSDGCPDGMGCYGNTAMTTDANTGDYAISNSDAYYFVENNINIPNTLGRTFRYCADVKQSGGATIWYYVYTGKGSDSGWQDFGSYSPGTSWQTICSVRTIIDYGGTGADAITQLRFYRHNQQGTIYIDNVRFQEIKSTTVLTGTKNYYANETTARSGSSSYGWAAPRYYSDSGLSANTQYCYNVKARDYVENEGSYSTESCRFTQAEVPAIEYVICAEEAGNIYCNVSFSMGTNPAGTQHYIEETTGHAGATDQSWTSSTAVYQDNNLNDNTLYCYRIRARNNESVNTSYSEEVCKLVDVTPPDIYFVPPTPEDNEYRNLPYSYINVTATDINNITAFIDWDNSLVGWWRFNGETDFTDHSTYTNDGTNQGSTYTTSGKFGGARSFDGTDDYVDCGNDEIPIGSSSFTKHVWVYLPDKI
ncbi:MAG: LamG-like jellyroll fold domain-containing protein, partial [archaeon]|nr:LamG-like jellyroll fold domain-containing protein [archaeon]